ncbi:hypothetical protein U3A55_11885 [Salarchaeum sp. III]|uniref:hypothetical protein n=1 Tax=Salarchaeum sp. III TaxID=3107927 RepID=UPI002ED83479
MFHHEDFTLELEQEDRAETAIIGLRYTGNKSSVAPRQPRREGGWPGRQTFQGGKPTDTDENGKVTAREPGPIQIGINPDWIDRDTVEGGTLAGLEALPDFEVIYDDELLAEAMLKANFLPPTVFGSPPDQTGGERITPVYEVREAVFDQLGLNDIGSGPGSHEEYRSQLAEVAGVDATTDEVPADKQREQQYIENHSRAALKDAAEVLREDTDDIALNVGKQEFAEWLATQPAGDVRDALAGEYETDDSDEE